MSEYFFSTISDKTPVFDFHCDLLAHLAISKSNTIYDEAAHCSLPQLQKGGVKIQVMAFFADPANADLQDYQQQLEHYLKLNQSSQNIFLPFKSYQNTLKPKEILILPAIENINLLFLDKENIEIGQKRLADFCNKVGLPFYAILVWKGENSFAGAFDTNVGLKEKGKYLVEQLVKRNIALDFSHASDFLIEDLLTFLDKENPNHLVLASHSNFRKITNIARNLSDDFAKEIAKRKGVIGMNAMCDFIGGEDSNMLLKHLEYGLTYFPDSLVLGLDFFSKQCLPKDYVLKYNSIFPKGLKNASQIPNLFIALQKRGYDKQILDKLNFNNGFEFFTRFLDQAAV